MANYNDLKTAIDAVIKTNGRQEISGAALNTQLKNMITELGAGYQFMGIATPATNPGTPDANVFYIASEAGTYTNFGGKVINEGEVCALVWNGSWTKQVTGAATAVQFNQLGQKVTARVQPKISDFEAGKRLLVDGSEQNFSWYSVSPFYGMIAGDVADFSGLGSNDYVLLAYYNADKSFNSVAIYGSGLGTLISERLTFPFSGYFRVSMPTDNLSAFSFAYAQENLAETVEKMQPDEVMKLNGEQADIASSSNFTLRGFYVGTSLSLESSANWRMSDPVLVKQGQTIKMRAAGAGTKTFAIVGVNSAVPITSITDEREFSIVCKTTFGEQFENVDFIFTATEDTYVILQYYRITNGFVYLDWLPMIEKAANLMKGQEETEDFIAEYEEENGQKPWVASEVEILVEKLRSLSQKSLSVFVFNTDQHYTQSNNGVDADKAIVRGLKSIREIAKEFPLDLIVLGGDEAGYGGDADNDLLEIADDVAKVYKNASSHLCPVIAIAGNHDALQNMGADNSDGYQEYNWKTRGNVVRKELDWSGVRSTNCWYDNTTQKVRFVFLDAYSVNQGTELADCIDSALSDNKLKNSEWSVFIFSHNVVSAAGTDITDPMPENVWAQIAGYINQGVNIIACINGHAHNITQGVKDGTLFISVNQALPVYSKTSPAINQSFDGNVYTNVLGTAAETAYQVFAFDKTDNKLFAFQYGAGTDRVFDTTPGQRGIQLDVLSGVVSSSATIEGGTIKATNHNTEHLVTLDATGVYSFPYLCPGLVWHISVELPGGQTASQDYNSVIGSHTVNISV